MKLLIAIPSYKFINVEAVHCMFSLLSDVDDGRTLALHGGEGFVGRSRNQICTKFLETDFDKLLMIDSDIIYTKENVDRISSHDEGIVCGFYPKKAPGKTVWVANHLSKNEKLDERGLIKVDTIGTGFMCLQRWVLEKMRDSGIAARYIVDGTDIVEYEFFPFRVVKGRLRSEDWAFCDNAHELGIPVYGDEKCVLRHLGMCVYPTQEAQMVERILKLIQKFQQAGEKISYQEMMTMLFDASQLDSSYNVSE